MNDNKFLKKKRTKSSNSKAKMKNFQKKKFQQSNSFSFTKSNPNFSYSYNSYEGKIRNYNEDKVQIKIDIQIPNKEKDIIWPSIHYFAIFDGHGGKNCSQFLKDNFHKLLIENKNFPRKPIKSLNQTFINVEQLFFNKYKPKNLIDNIENSGSCALIILIIENKIYCANLGDSRGIYSENSSKIIYQINKEHKPNSKSEKERIYNAGGKIYQNNNYLGLKNIPWRILPGKLSISRAFGDLYAKIPELGGNSKVLISKPEIITFELNSKSDFIILGCDGIFDSLSNKDICKIAWNNFYNGNDIFYLKNVCDKIMLSSMDNGSVDNISCIFIGFNNYFTILKDIYLNKSLNCEKIIGYLENNNCDKLIKSSNLYYDEKNKKKVKNIKEAFENAINYQINCENKVFYSDKKINPKDSSIENYYNELNN